MSSHLHSSSSSDDDDIVDSWVVRKKDSSTSINALSSHDLEPTVFDLTTVPTPEARGRVSRKICQTSRTAAAPPACVGTFELATPLQNQSVVSNKSSQILHEVVEKLDDIKLHLCRLESKLDGWGCSPVPHKESSSVASSSTVSAPVRNWPENDSAHAKRNHIIALAGCSTDSEEQKEQDNKKTTVARTLEASQKLFSPPITLPPNQEQNAHHAVIPKSASLIDAILPQEAEAAHAMDDLLLLDADKRSSTSILNDGAERDYTILRKKQLAELCRARNLPVRGNRPDLIHRLQSHDNHTNETSNP